MFSRRPPGFWGATLSGDLKLGIESTGRLGDPDLIGPRGPAGREATGLSILCLGWVDVEDETMDDRMVIYGLENQWQNDKCVTNPLVLVLPSVFLFPTMTSHSPRSTASTVSSPSPSPTTARRRPEALRLNHVGCVCVPQRLIMPPFIPSQYRPKRNHWQSPPESPTVVYTSHTHSRLCGSYYRPGSCRRL